MLGRKKRAVSDRDKRELRKVQQRLVKLEPRVAYIETSLRLIRREEP